MICKLLQYEIIYTKFNTHKNRFGSAHIIMSTKNDWDDSDIIE